jgi:hypothetical protein
MEGASEASVNCWERRGGYIKVALCGETAHLVDRHDHLGHAEALGKLKVLMRTWFGVVC